MIQDIVHGGYSIVRTAVGHVRAHKVLGPTLQQRMRTVGRHREQLDVINIVVGQMRDWSKGRLSFLVANQQRHGAITKEH